MDDTVTSIINVLKKSIENYIHIQNLEAVIEDMCCIKNLINEKIVNKNEFLKNILSNSKTVTDTMNDLHRRLKIDIDNSEIDFNYYNSMLLVIFITKMVNKYSEKVSIEIIINNVLDNDDNYIFKDKPLLDLPFYKTQIIKEVCEDKKTEIDNILNKIILSGEQKSNLKEEYQKLCINNILIRNMKKYMESKYNISASSQYRQYNYQKS